ncbi:MAG: DNA polymerase [Thermoplasmata archaeon]
MYKNRPAHILKSNKSVKIPKKFIFFDTETEQIKISSNIIQQKFKLVTCIFYQRGCKTKKEIVEYKYFLNSEDFFKYVESKLYKKEKLILISHNIHFDFCVLGGYEWICKNKWKVKSFVDSSNLYIMSIEKDCKRIELINSFNFFRTTIKQLGELLNLPKIEIDFNNCSLDDLITYSFRDCEILFNIFKTYIKFIEVNDLGTFQKTISSQSFTAFRHKFMKHQIYIHNDKTALEIERKSYYGGRNECFYIGKIEGENIYKLDINSMYPFVMKINDYPIKLIKKLKNVSLENLENYLEKYCVIGVVKIKTNEPVYPFRIQNRTCFVVGEGNFILTTPELEYAYKNNHIKKIYKLIIYEKANIFSDFVEFFYSERINSKNKGDKVFSDLYKLILNSLYGKFGQLGNEWRFVEYSDNFEFKYIESVNKSAGKKYSWRQIGNRIEERIERGEAYNSFVAIASHVTAYARIYLWNLIKTAGIENVYYVDTDSLFVNETGYKNLLSYIDNNNIGKLKVEGISNYLEIRGLKDYTFGDIVKIKGVKIFEDNSRGNEFIQIRFPQFRLSLRKGWLKEYFTEIYLKRLKRVYLKGEVAPNGKVKPISIGFNPKVFLKRLLSTSIF